MKTVRLGIIGLGNIAQKIHLPLLAKMSDVSLAAVCDNDPRKEALLQGVSGRPRFFSSAQGLLSLPELDAVVICTPNHSHAHLVEMALKAEKHVICEKPLAISTAQTNALSATAAQSKKMLMVNFTNRFRSDVARMRKLIHAGELGAITKIQLTWMRHRGIPGQGSWFTSKSHAGGGALMDLGSHLLDLALWLLPRAPRKMLVFCKLFSGFLHSGQADASWYGKSSEGMGADVEDAATAMLLLDNRILISLRVAWASKQVSQDSTHIDVCGENGELRLRTLFGFSNQGIRPDKPLTFIHFPSGEEIPVPLETRAVIDPLDPYIKQNECWMQYIRQPDLTQSTFHDGHRCTMLVEALYQAHREGCCIELNDHPMVFKKPVLSYL